MKITVDFYKETGKWYSTLVIERVTDVFIFDTEGIVSLIKNHLRAHDDMPFTFLAEDEKTGAMNKRLVR